MDVLSPSMCPISHLLSRGGTTLQVLADLSADLWLYAIIFSHLTGPPHLRRAPTQHGRSAQLWRFPATSHRALSKAGRWSERATHIAPSTHCLSSVQQPCGCAGHSWQPVTHLHILHWAVSSDKGPAGLVMLTHARNRAHMHAQARMHGHTHA